MYRLIERIIYSLLIMLSACISAAQDPMRPPNWAKSSEVSSVATEKLELQQILISVNRKLVVINDKVLQEGQTVSGVRIIEIEAGQIKIRRGGVNTIVKLLPATKEVSREL